MGLNSAYGISFNQYLNKVITADTPNPVLIASYLLGAWIAIFIIYFAGSALISKLWAKREIAQS